MKKKPKKKLHVFVRCMKCGEQGRKEIAARDPNSLTGYRNILPCGSHLAENKDPTDTAAYTDSMEALIRAVETGKAHTKKLAHAGRMARKIRLPLKISVGPSSDLLS